MRGRLKDPREGPLFRCVDARGGRRGTHVRRLTANDLAIGMALPWSVYDRGGKLLLVQGMAVTSPTLLGILLERGMIESERELMEDMGVRVRGLPKAAKRPTGDREQALARDAGQSVFRTVKLMRRELEQLHDDLLEGRSEGLGGQAQDLAARLEALVARDADAALAAMQLEVADDGEAARVLHAATLCQVMVQALHWDEDQGRSLVAAALTYDVALGPVSATLNRQQGELSEDQRAMVEAHPHIAVDLLQAAGVDDPVWMDAVHHHHERLDGSGYPNQLEGDAIAPGARLLAIVDIFSAMVRPRAYREAAHARDALRKLFLERGRAVDEEMAAQLIRQIGVYPPGTPVGLANGEVGVVLRRGPDATRPVVARLLNANGTLAGVPQQRDTSRPEYAITRTVAPQKYQLLVSGAARLWDS